MLPTLPARDGELAPGDRPRIRMCPVWPVAALEARDSTSQPRDCVSQPLDRCTNGRMSSTPCRALAWAMRSASPELLGCSGMGGALDHTCGEIGLIAATLCSVSLVTLGTSCVGSLADGVRCGGGVPFCC